MGNQSKQIAKRSQSSFYYAFSLLNPVKRDAMNTVYAFCKSTDDIIDEGYEPDEVRYDKLRKWRIELEKSIKGNSEYQLLNKLGLIIKQFNIPLEPFFELIRGMEMDLQRKRYLTFDDLKEYCYRVASTVGLMCIEIFGYKNKSTREYAINLGLALQLTNILRDIKKDADLGRVYLPQNDMVKFNYSEHDILTGKYNQNFISLMQYEANRAKILFQTADAKLDFEDKPSMFAARAMEHIYKKLLNKLESQNFDVFNKNINVNKLEKAAISLGVWAKYSLVY
ncbi:presqualene diphosphate synthase HpnD [Melioribacteraceae bacterium 4301-Me]|uniref:presqualene diphosphate synthase HpnD n=1 Tax=Pyranulibacter aquaticus TaxID=3163344 RepID=UPI0035953F05